LAIRELHFSADLYVLRPADAARGNGTLLFAIANRGRKGLLGRFNRAGGSQDPTTPADFGDGFLMKEGYTLVWVGWQFDVGSPGLRVAAPAANVTGRLRFSFIPDEKRTEIYALLGSYVPLARTRAEREDAATRACRSRSDTKGVTYLQRIRAAANALVKERFILAEDVEDVVQRATKHWEYVTRTTQTN
jgi:hypothetical protein